MTWAGRLPATVWVRWRTGERWSIWHRAAPGKIGVTEAKVLGVTVQRINVSDYLEDARITTCGLVLPRGVISEERYALDAAYESRCAFCLSGYMSTTPPSSTGSPGGEPTRPPGRLIIYPSSRRRPSNQPAL
jgi:hypothetical protein